MEPPVGSVPAPTRLRLYVTGSTPRSLDAIARLRALCEKHLEPGYDLAVIDIYQQPELARSADLVATPTLVREEPKPVRRLVGDLGIEDRVVRLLRGDRGPPEAPAGKP